jgi:putative hydrolase of the HAD superfamily
VSNSGLGRRERARALLVDVDGVLRRPAPDGDGSPVDPEVLAFIREVRAAGLPVGLTTNGTDRLDPDLEALGGEVDAVVTSAEVGAPKPAPQYFMAACVAVGVPPRLSLFVDDSDRVVRGARAAGLSAYRWTGPADLPYLRAALAL